MSGLEKKAKTGFKKILVGTDFSDYSARAVAYAEMLSVKFGAEILLFHVIESFTYSVTDSMTVVGHDQALVATANALIDNLKKGLDDRKVSATCFVEHGTAYREIVKKAEDEGVDLIVIGAHGRTGMEQLLIGSVAEKVVRLASCPVLTIPGE